MKYKSILVPINGADYAEEMIELACKLADRDEAELHALYVYVVPRTLPIDASVPVEENKGAEVLARAEAAAAAAGVGIRTHFYQSRSAGVSILDAVERLQADLVVLGVSGEPRVGGIFFGATTSLVLKNAPCRVLIGRAGMEV